MATKQHVYACPNTKCRDRGKEVKMGMSPAEHRAATGRWIKCATCEDIMRWVRAEQAPEAPFE